VKRIIDYDLLLLTSDLWLMAYCRKPLNYESRVLVSCVRRKGSQSM